MNIKTKKYRVILNEIKNNKDSFFREKEFCVIELLFNSESFYKKCRTVGEFLKKLKNNKNSLFHLPNNRIFFQNICENGFHHSIVYQEKIEIFLFIELKQLFNVTEMKSRISKIVKPEKIKITFNDELVLMKKFDADLVISSIGIFGNEFTKKVV